MTAPSSVKTDKNTSRYSSGDYWRDRSDLLYYRYIEYILRVVGRDAKSLLDVGSGNSPYLEWFDWIEDRRSVDIRVPYSSDNVQGIKGDIHKLSFDKTFDLCTCFQVLEHVPDAAAFARRLQELSETLIISVPFKWPENWTKGHIHDPVDYEKLTGWMGRKANYKMVVREPFRRNQHQRLIAIYDRDPDRRFGRPDIDQRIRRDQRMD
ncbi:MAG: methyltransferase domain-containing protein [Pseudomonadota bacterium]